MKLKISFQARIAGVLIALLLIVVGAVFLAVKFATGDAVRMPGRPYRITGGPEAASLPAPATPGMHTEEVLAEWLGGQ